MSEQKEPGRKRSRRLRVSDAAAQTERIDQWSEETSADSDETSYEMLETMLSHPSAVFELDPQGRLLSGGVDLRSIGEETALPAIRQGKHRYQVLKLIGRGGMGDVYLAYDRDLRRRVALKTIRQSAQRSRFMEEAQILGQLEHPNVVPIHELGLTSEQSPFCSMRYVRGRTLEEIILGLAEGDAQITETYSLTRLIQIFLQIAQAIDYAHDRGVVHRDLKPANVVLGEHGEVQVLDWGLAKVLEREGDSVETDNDGLTRPGEVMGTPAYMPPEQATGGLVTEQADIYMLGVILYEMLTLQRPFRGDNRAMLLAAILRDPPRAPREVAPERRIPLVLQQVCLKALSKEAPDRQSSVHELQNDIQTWLETETDKVKRHERAQQLAAEGREKLETYRRLRIEIARLEADAKDLEQQLQPWLPIEKKAPLLETQDEITQARLRMAQAASNVVMTVAAALGQEDSNPEARTLMADFQWEQFLDAEGRKDEDRAAYFRNLVEAFHDGKYARELKGDGALTLESDPAGAEVWLYEFVERELQMVPGEGRRLGTTPLQSVDLPMGSYLVVLKKDGYSETRYPVLISRNRHWEGKVSLYTEQEIGEGFAYIPAGPFIQGGDPALPGWSLPASSPLLEDYCIGVHPVTLEEYLEFLNSLAENDIEAALKVAPRWDMVSNSYLVRDEADRFKLPDIGFFGNDIHPRQPVQGVSWYGGQAYCAWRSQRDGREYRLPTESEWEKSVRGVDGRSFPWGDRFDATLCNSPQSTQGRPGPLPVDNYPTDVSVFGVRGAAGNLRDWTGTLVKQGEGETALDASVIRGAAAEFAGTSDFTIMSRCAFRWVLPLFYINPGMSFRIAHVPTRRGK